MSVQFSSHTGYPGWRGRAFDAGMIDDCVAGLDAIGVLPRCAGLLTGYLGRPEIGEAALRALDRLRAANPDAAYACDPVIGDVGRGSYVAAGRRRIPPRPRRCRGDDRDAQRLRAGMADRRAGERPRPGGGGDRRRCAHADRVSSSPNRCRSTIRRQTRSTFSPATIDGLWRLRTPKLPIAVNGAGDLFAALFFHHWLDERKRPPRRCRGRRRPCSGSSPRRWLQGRANWRSSPTRRNWFGRRKSFRQRRFSSTQRAFTFFRYRRKSGQFGWHK